MKKIFYTALSVMLILSSCKKGFEETNQPWNKATTADLNTLYNGIVKSLVLTWNEQSVGNSWIYPITQQAAIVGTTGYRMTAASDDIWKDYYRTLTNFRRADKLIEESADKSKMANIQAMLKILRAYKTFKMTDIFGDMPYFEGGKAVDGSIYYKVKFDSQKVIYETLLDDLKSASAALSANADQLSLGTSETFLNNDIAKWKKFANSLRLRYAIRMYEVNKTIAQAHIKEVVALPLLTQGEDMGIWPAKVGFTLEGREWAHSGAKYRMGTTAWNLLSDNSNTDGSGIFDQRAKLFFETNVSGTWVPREQNPTAASISDGGDPYNKSNRDANWNNKGATNVYSNVNHYLGRDMNSIPELIITAAEVNFLKAEVSARGMDGNAANMANAKTEYESGIRNSVNFWTKVAMDAPIWVVNKPTALPTMAQLSWITTNPKVLFPVAANEAQATKLIYAQLWLDNFRQPYEAWALLRRTQATPMETVNAAYYEANFASYKRLDYPDDEKNFNGDNLRVVTGGLAAQAWQNTKVWWAK
ncbi:Starch-binding associating with outer membrane [Pedobacter steynii]|uniref:Starch-binding associating with outer membrane n=1 Tax=Pedobacter steynii TaxID=430522 RepID=A0A1H0IZQ8_9SPHI|nr:SusD/RagB family nutrient-binding outer membrane lipoprotein [Pedobacter steynii]NQX42991.1 SusD/RagB family nutrient-binding outer membrane lipoprotein [Pedobacter steynii]SDO36997.1 Starch-binding associating with outer membrane [Pedobacter steynii]